MKKNKILIAGASGSVGIYLVHRLLEQGFSIRALTHSEKGQDNLSNVVDDIWFADAADDVSHLKGITQGVDYIISVMGKAVSLFDPDSDSFYNSNYLANLHLLEEAKKYHIEKFIYVSMMGADPDSPYTIPKTHGMTEKEIKNSGLNFSIIRPVGFFSALNDLILMGQHKVIPLVGDGEAKTNSIYHKDLAGFLAETFKDLPELIEVGGPGIHTRKEMAEMIQKKTGGKIVKTPEFIARNGSKVAILFSKDNLGHKLDYFAHIMSTDMIGEKRGMLSFQTYLEKINLDNLDEPI